MTFTLRTTAGGLKMETRDGRKGKTKEQKWKKIEGDLLLPQEVRRQGIKM